MCFLWFEDVSNNNFALKGYYSNTVCFGIRPAPCLLMLTLFHFLVYSVPSDDELKDLKRQIYDLLYVDNGALTSEGPLFNMFSKLPEIFRQNGFELQEFASNDKDLKKRAPKFFEDSEPDSKLLGMLWNTEKDVISPKKFELNESACTKRSILSSIASNFDLLNIGGPILNRARIFMHDLQCETELSWDTEISYKLHKNWKLICKQVNSTPSIEIPRYVGSRDSEFNLIACVDASRYFFGAVLYLFEVETSKISFLFSRNRMITSNLKNRSMPTLELMAVELGTKLLQTAKYELSGPLTCNPINISKLKLFSDSSIALSWISSYGEKFAKMSRRNVFVMNRLNSIMQHCNKFPVYYNFTAGKENPGDCTTRPISYNILSKSSYWTGPNPDTVTDESLAIVIPSPKISDGETSSYASSVICNIEPLVDSAKFSSFKRLIRVHYRILSFISKLKSKANISGGVIPVEPNCTEALWKKAYCNAIISEQVAGFPDVVSYFKNGISNIKNVPNLVTQLNLFRDSEGLLRVRCKISHIGKSMEDFPILLPKDNHVTRSIILDIHQKLNHAGKYSVLSEFRKLFYVSSCFSTVKKVLRTCVHCRRFNSSPIVLNQNSYRNFRLDPSHVPFQNIFIDYLGPIMIKIKGEKCKAYVLLFTCLFSRAINLQICLDLTEVNFLRAFQLHVFKYGFPSLCLSDRGSQICSGAKVIEEHISDKATQEYLNANGIKHTEFSQYAKGCKKLGGLVETCVKMVKRLIFGSIRKYIPSYSDFEYVIAEVNHIVNKRPVCFKEGLRDNDPNNEIPTAITPEMIINGRELVSLNVIPDLGKELDDWSADIKTNDMYDNVIKITLINKDFL